MLLRTLFTCLVVCGLFSQAFGQSPPITFLARTDLPNLEQNTLALADVNNDGILDIVAGENFEVWLGNGDGTFTALPLQQSLVARMPASMQQTSAGKSAGLLSLVDVNGDGNLDVVEALSTNQFLVALGNGDGTFQNFTSAPTYFVRGRPLSLISADINGDGYPDLVIGTDKGAVEEVLNDGTGQFTVHTLELSASPVGAVAVRDINGDGIRDVVYGVEGAVKVLLGTGHGAFQPGSTISVMGLPGSLAFADFDGDGNADLAIGGSDSVKYENQITILHGDGKGNFGTPEIIPASGVTQIAVGDIDHDGHPDIAVLESDPDVLAIYFNKGDGTFRSPVHYSAASDARDLALGSLRGNGFLDIVVTGVTGLEISTLLNEGRGVFRDGSRIRLSAEPLQLISADFNHDGLDDLADVEAGTIQIYLATGKKYKLFSAGQNLAVDAVTLISGDFNGDGILDLAFTNASNQIGIVFGDGTGKFGSPIYTAPGGIVNPYNFLICAGDFNGDGKLDIATSYDSVLFGSGDGTFGPPIQILSQAMIKQYFPVIQLAAADLNGDGKSDLVFINGPALAWVFPLISDGTGKFTYTGPYEFGATINQMLIADINGDGHLDVIGSFMGSLTTAYMLGDGAGDFGPVQSFFPPNVPPLYNFGLVSADFNNDGITDLAVSTSVQGSIAVYAGQGNAALSLPTFWGTAPNATYLVKGHFYGTRTGYPDLAVTSADGIDILLNTSE